MRRLNEIYPAYSDRVAFYAVGLPGERLHQLESYRQQEEHPWPVAEPTGSMVQDLRVVQQSTKLAFDAAGVIIYRDGYGEGDPATWEEVFQRLAASRPE